MNKELNDIIEKVERLKEGLNKELLVLRETERIGLREWSNNEDDLINKCYVYGYLSGRGKLICDIEETLYVLQQCSSTLLFISYGIAEEDFHKKDILNSVILVENSLSDAVNKLSCLLDLNNKI